jgi:DNA-directed RNA polymerase subunit M/transcription elongation factor TFIIS
MYRKCGKTALSKILKIEKNIIILEKNIYEAAVKIDNNNTQNPYQDICMDVITMINQGTKLNTILQKLKKGKLMYDSELFNDVRDSLSEQQNFLENPFEVDEGVIECKCGSRRTISFSKQTRCGDEGTTVFAKCVDCGKSWIM